MKFLEHRIGDRRIIRLIQKWLRAGVIEGTEWKDTGKGTPQGAVISPLLANVFLHYVLDLWVHQWRRQHAQGECYIVRYADDVVLGFEHEADARACLSALHERLQQFGLRLHPEKTRLIEFGRDSAARREREGRGRCETFDFLGFTHTCTKTRKTKRFTVGRITMAKRMRRTLAAIKIELARRRHDPLGQTGRWLGSVLRGWLGYHAVPGNFQRLEQFKTAIKRLWLRQLQRRSQHGRARWNWQRMPRVVSRYFPRLRILHPYPATRFRARLRAGAV